MKKADKYEGLIDAEGYVDYDGLDHLLAEVKRLREELDAAEDVILYALDRVGNDDDAKKVFEDFLEGIK
tara:strand:+ start:190 stop:396 length:207 start_codon:yes stop_codon:yes gene_type:complete